ncbi:MAG: hypothetical protein LDLANPLL_00489 [Turneriella sp.]|nr:hypothetical protein [Turneriella sp.]
MARSFLFAALAILFAALAFFAERYAFISRVSSLLEVRFKNLQDDLERLDKETSESLTQKKVVHYFEKLPSTKIARRETKGVQEVFSNPNTDLVESAILTDVRFSTLTRTGRDLTLDERMRLQRNEEDFILSEEGLLRRYTVKNSMGKPIGYIVFALRPDTKRSASALFMASFDFRVITPFSRDAFNGEEKKLIESTLKTLPKKQETFSLRSKEYIVLRQTWFRLNAILFQVSEAAPLYTYWSIYFSFLLFILVLVSFVRVIRAQAATNRELSERTLLNHGQALAAQSSALDILSNLEKESLEKEINANFASATVADPMDAIDEKIRRGLANNPPPREKNIETIVIDVGKEKRAFKFMNPALTESARPSQRTHLTVKESRIREKALSDELKTLMASVTSPVEGAEASQVVPHDLLKALTDFEEKHRYPTIDQYLYYLNELYFDDVTQEELAEALRVAGETVQSSAFAVMLYEPANAVYKTGFSQGVPKNFKDYFYLLPKDTVLEFSNEEYAYVEFSQKLQKSSFFTKRFPAGFVQKYKGMHLFSLTENFLKARLVFFDESRGGGIESVEIVRNVKDYLKQIAPAIKMYFIEVDAKKANAYRLEENAVRELKEALAAADFVSPLISQYVFERALSLPEIETLVDEIAIRLSVREKVILMSPSHLIVLQEEASTNTVEEVIRSRNVEFLIKESKFGVKSRNLFTFIEF